MARVLVVFASVGSGHARAAQGLAAALAASGVEHEVVDVLRFTDPAYRNAYKASYLKLATHAPEVWGYLYNSSDKGRVRAKAPTLIRAFDRLEFARFRRFVRDFAPDALLCTHFLPVQVLAPSRGKAWAGFRVGLVVTDYYAHGFWAQPAADLTFCPTEESLHELSARGIQAAKLAATGIPVMPEFAAPMTREAARAKLNLPGKGPVVLVMGGGWGGGGVVELVGDVLETGEATVLAVAGRNARAQAAIEAMNHPRLRAFGFVENIHELMVAADVCVSKSGGLTTAECLALGLPMVVPNPIPGQEERNANHLAECGAGLVARSPASLKYKLRGLLADDARRAQMSRAAARQGRPHAAREIVARLAPGGA